MRPMMVGGRMVPQRGGLGAFGGASRLSTEQLSRQGVSMSHITVPKGEPPLRESHCFRLLYPNVSQRPVVSQLQRSVVFCP